MCTAYHLLIVNEGFLSEDKAAVNADNRKQQK